ncbi:MAG: hypothetical protein LH609_22985 [Rudanella sp.]|nr:hypothetical protein [Rudanella sp.]
MTLTQIPDVNLLTVEMDTDSLNTLSYVFCENKPFTRFVELYTWFLAGLPGQKRIGEFWEEVEDLGITAVLPPYSVTN